MRFLRTALSLDSPEAHLSGPQFGFAILTLLASGLTWSLVTKSWFVLPMTVLSQVIPAWSTRRARERALGRLALSFMLGGVWALAAVLIRRWNQQP